MIDLKNLNIILTGATGVIGNSILEVLINFRQKLRKKFSINASYYAQKNFSITSVTKNIYKIYNL